MTYSKKLKLPAVPFKNWDSFYKLDFFNFFNRQWLLDKVQLYPVEYLTDETMDILATHNIKPSYLVLFKDYFEDLNNLPDRTRLRLIHRDIIKNPETKQWDKVSCGINWEMFNESTFSWWDMSALNEVYPDETDPGYNTSLAKKADKLGRSVWFDGVHYSQEQKRSQSVGVNEGAVQLGEQHINIHTPYLVRTDIPHMVIYSPTSKVRYSISIRVENKDVGSWEDALELFKPLYE